MTATGAADSTFACGCAQIRSHFRHLAMIVTVHGEIDAANLDRIIEYTRCHILAADRLVLDLTDVNSLSAEGISLLFGIADDCDAADVEWMLVTSPLMAARLRNSEGEPVFSIANSIPEALHRFADSIDRRRKVLLPLVRKTA